MIHETILREQLPEVFGQCDVPEDWRTDFDLVAIPDPEQDVESRTKEPGHPDPFFDALSETISGLRYPVAIEQGAMAQLVTLFGRVPRPGAPITAENDGCPPPPDALAFYLPFHYYPTWWGIYITVDGLLHLTEVFSTMGNHTFPRHHYGLAARFFLYAHEFYHYRIESLATRIEVTHRRPVYIDGFERHYRNTLNYSPTECLEEALANGYAYERLQLKLKNDPAFRDHMQAITLQYIKTSRPPYQRGHAFRTYAARKKGECLWVEDSHHETFPQLKKLKPTIWETGGSFSRGFGDIRSRIQYILPRPSMLKHRINLKP